MNNSINIRKARPEDIESVVAIETASGGTWRNKMFESELKNSFSLFLVSETSTAVTGFAVAWVIEKEAQLNKICVAPKQRRKGTASALIRAVEILLDPELIQLEVAEKNSDAFSLYSSLGFTRTGFRKNYYPDDNALLMELNLTNENRHR